MKAAVVTSFDRPLELQDRPDPQPAAGEVLVRIETSGLCHTDIHAAHGDWPVKPALPFVPGHEGVGIVEQVGIGVTTPAVGDRVAIPWLGWACGECEWCIKGWETLCPHQQNTGYGRDGGYAEYGGRVGEFVVPRSGRHRSARRRPADVRRSDDVQGRQGRRSRPVGSGRRVRCRRPRPHGRSVRADRWRHRRCRSTSATTSCRWPATLGATH